MSMKKGVSRGIFSNEAGLGTGSIAHACADTKKPVKQGFFGIFEVFVDTIVICTLTALVILCSGVSVGYGEAAGAELTITSFTTTPESKNTAIRFGMTIRPLKVSAMLHISPRFIVAPTIATSEYTTMNGLFALVPNKNSMHLVP